jgi:pre-mRNA-splicing helicase BRR2
MTPLRQFKGVQSDIIRKAEGKQFVSCFKSSIRFNSLGSAQPWYRYFDLVSLRFH